MQDPRYYRREAEHARRLSRGLHQPELIELLRRLADDFEDIATDLEAGAVKIVHPSRMPQQHRSPPKG